MLSGYFNVILKLVCWSKSLKCDKYKIWEGANTFYIARYIDKSCVVSVFHS